MVPLMPGFNCEKCFRLPKHDQLVLFIVSILCSNKLISFEDEIAGIVTSLI